MIVGSSAAALVGRIAGAVVMLCPVCFDPNDSNRAAFVATTVFLSVLPVAMIGGIVLWIRARLGRRDD